MNIFIKSAATIIALIIVALILPTCGARMETVRQLMSFENSRVVLPEIMMVLEDGNVYYKKLPSECNRFIAYFGSEDCSNCVINRIEETINPLIRVSDSLKLFEVITIMTPPMEERDGVIEAIKRKRYMFPIYIDDLNTSNLSETIPEDSRFHFFLLGKSGRVKYVGYPINNEGISLNFIKTISY